MGKTIMKEYEPKIDPLSVNRVNKLLKESIKILIDRSKEDRENAISAYKYFKNLLPETINLNAVDEETGEVILPEVLYKSMLESLKLAQTSKQSELKLIELLAKMRLQNQERKKGAAKESATISSSEDLFDED